MNIYLTGATGYVGKRLVPRLLNDGHRLTCLMRHPEAYADIPPYDRCQLVPGDVTDLKSFQDTLAGADAVVHLAVTTPLNIGDRCDEAYIQTNAVGTTNLLQACIRVSPSRIVCFSSTAAIGRPQVDRIDEKTMKMPQTAYGRSKMSADEQVAIFVSKHGLPALILCFPHIYGPGDTTDFFHIVKMIRRGVFPQVGFTPNLLPMVYIDDAVAAIVLSLTRGRPGETYIIADDDPHDTRTVRKIVRSSLGINKQIYPWIPRHAGILGACVLEKIFEGMGKKPPVRAENIRSVVAGRRLCIEKAEKELGFKPQVTLAKGIDRTIAYYKENHLL